MVKYLSRRLPNVTVPKALRSLDVSPRTAKGVSALAKNNPWLKRTLKSLDSKKVVGAVAVATVFGVGASHVAQYIKENSGCFLLEGGRPVGKLQELSCCNPERSQEVPFVQQFKMQGDRCKGFGEKAENSCCRLCDCQYHTCAPGQELECRRPNVVQALSHFGHGMVTGIKDALFDFLPFLKPLGLALACLIACLVFWKIFF